MKLFISSLLCLVCFACCSQTNSINAIKNVNNKIYGDSISLHHFFTALDSLKTDTCKVVSIVHIGDSHIQADYFSGTVRVLLQETFGNAGRGLIFPYKVAHTNEPVNYSSSSLSKWTGIRNVLNPNKIKLGISGVSLFTRSNQANLNLKIKNQRTLNYAFNSVDLFSEQASAKNARVISNSGMIVCEEKTVPFISHFKLKDTTHALNFQFSDFNTIDIHGIVLTNDNSGILYHTIGVNGATFKSYNNTDLFIEQLKYLKPDLIIISLGTNESYAPKFDLNEFNYQSTRFIESIKSACGNCSILLTTPSDNCKLRKGKVFSNDKPKIIANHLRAYAKQHHYALWDLHTVMGGTNSMKVWKKQGLAAKDYVHFSRKGYELQGILLFEAIMDLYLKIK